MNLNLERSGLTTICIFMMLLGSQVFGYTGIPHRFDKCCKFDLMDELQTRILGKWDHSFYISLLSHTYIRL